MLDCERRPSATPPSTESRAPRSITCPMRVLMAGCGYVGSALGLLLTAEGHLVFGLRRDTSTLSSSITPVQVDLSSPLLSDTLSPNLDALVYSASPSGSTDKAYRAAYLDVARNLVSTLESQKRLRRVVFVSSTEVYAQKGSGWVRNRPPSPRASPAAPAGWRTPRTRAPSLRASSVSAASTAPA